MQKLRRYVWFLPTSALCLELTPTPPQACTLPHSGPPTEFCATRSDFWAWGTSDAGVEDVYLTGYVAPWVPAITCRGREWTTVAADPHKGQRGLFPPRNPMFDGGMKDGRFPGSPAASGRRAPLEGPPAKCSMCPRDQDRRRGPREKEKGGGKRFRFGPCHVESQTTSSMRMDFGLQKTFE